MSGTLHFKKINYSKHVNLKNMLVFWKTKSYLEWKRITKRYI